MFMDLSDPASQDDRPGLLAKVSPADNSQPLTVTELSGALKRTVEAAFGFVRVRGEISGWKRHASGHCYFTLKDDSACIDAVIWRGQSSALAFEPQDGLEVIGTGKLTTYAGRSKYQIVVDRLEIAGEGALMALLEQRKRTLAGEGLFDASRKRKLPFLPQVIGVITSPTGAVIRDIIHRLEDRCPSRVLLWPVPVQGEGAAARIAAAIRGFPAMEPRPEVIIVARGGGSIEDLWAFNEEDVVRAVADCPIPLISAVGHETDTTLIDFAADRRAPTPTAAAEMAVPVRAELASALSDLGQRMRTCLVRAAQRAGERLELTMHRWPEAKALLAPVGQRLDEIGDRLPRALAARAAHARADFSAIAPRLRHELVSQRIEQASERLAGLWRLAGLAHPERPLQRGFVRVTDREGHTLIHAAAARAAGMLHLRFADGTVEAIVEGSVARLERAAPRSYRPQLAKPGRPTSQPGLFDED
jgi:exodeoxyribonuclease VII large subunit